VFGGIISQSKSKSHYDRLSVGQSVLVSSPIWGPRSDFYYCQTFAVLWMGGATGLCPRYIALARTTQTSFATLYSIVPRVSVAEDTYLSSRYQAMAIFVSHVTLVFFQILLSPSMKFLGYYHKQVTTASFHIPPTSLLAHLPIIRSVLLRIRCKINPNIKTASRLFILHTELSLSNLCR
jgi:hypothetical protein